MSWAGIAITAGYFIGLTALLCLTLFAAAGFILAHTYRFKLERNYSIATMAAAVPVAILLAYIYVFKLPPTNSMENESPCHDTRADYEC